MKRLIYLGTLLCIPVICFSACGKPDVSVESLSGVTREISVRVPFDPMNDTVLSLRIDNEGNVYLVNRIEIHHGKVNPERTYYLETCKIHKDGVEETVKLGPYKAIRLTRERNYILAADDTNAVTWLDSNSLDIKTMENEGLSLALKAFIGDYFNDKIMTHAVPLSSKIGVERWLAVHDTSAGTQVVVDFTEEYVNVDGIDFHNNMILVQAGRGIGRPVTLYILGLDDTGILNLDSAQQSSGTRIIRDTEHIRVDIRERLLDARLTGDGLVVLLGDSLVVETDPENRESSIFKGAVLKKYSLNGEEEWHKTLPVQGVTGVRLLERDEETVVVVTIVDSNNSTGFIGYYASDGGDEIYSRIVQGSSLYQGFFSIRPLEGPGSYYVHPQPSGYPQIPSYGGKVSRYSRENETASADFHEAIYHLATSPDGNCFSVISEGTLSIFSINRVNK